jgi:predicted phage-related endonuclease
METLDLIQGSREWVAARLNYFTASEAPAMMAQSKHVSRNELLHMKATGTEQEFSDWFQKNVLDKGHRVEAAAREVAEQIIGEELFPVTGCNEHLLASFDGLTMMEDVSWECKQWNEYKASIVKTGKVPDEDYWQVVHQMAVSGSEKVLYMVTDGDEKQVHVWVERNLEHEQVLLSSWAQFEKDLENYEPSKYEPEAKGNPVSEFPALFIDLSGEVQGTNLATYQEAVVARIKAISTDLKTDQDFADAESMVKFLDGAEKEIETVKKQALAKTASIDELFRTVDHLREEMRSKRLELNKLVTARKKELKIDIATKARAAVDEHIASLNKGLGGAYMPQIITDFNGAMKNKRSVATLQSSADDEVARAKIEASEIAEKIRTNLKLIDDSEHDFLFGDRQQLALKDTDDLEVIISQRVSQHKAAEEERSEKEREKIREEEQAKLKENQPETAPEDNQQPVVETAPPAATPLEPAEVIGSPSRPGDDEIIEALSLHFRVHESKVIEWLTDMDLKRASEKLAANF